MNKVFGSFLKRTESQGFVLNPDQAQKTQKPPLFGGGSLGMHGREARIGSA